MMAFFFHGFVVQRIEWEFPKLLIQVLPIAIGIGEATTKAVQQCAAFCLYLSLIKESEM